jgi:hypothetical protein
MSDMLKAFGTTGSAQTGPTYKHPLEEEIIREASSLLMQIPEGKRLLKYAKDHDIHFHAVSGREPGFRYGDGHNLFLLCPANTKAVDLDEMACNLGLAIREIEQPSVGIPRPIPGAAGIDLESATFNHMLDIIIEMCKITDEFVALNGSTKLVDLIEKLGHAELHRGIRSGLPHQELAEILSKKIKSV